MTPPDGNTHNRRDWHAQDVTTVFAVLDADTQGLTGREAGQRLAQYGPNRLRAARARGPLPRFISQFHNVLIYVLLAAALLTAMLQHWIDTGVIAGVVFINALIGFIQEGKAEKALAAIHNILPHYATVRRDGVWREINAEEAVPGDVVALQAGDKVPADIRLYYSKTLQIDEAILTGESVPSLKATDSCAGDAALGDRRCLAFSGTLVTYGQAHGVIVATGEHTEIGRISGLLAGVNVLTTPLLRRIGKFGRQLTAAIAVSGALTFAFGVLLRDYSATEMALVVVGLCVAAIPEGLPAIMTITLAIGVQRMARRNAIIRRLPAVETLGSVTVICTDKTGTLTRNEMTVRIAATAADVFEITGAGYAPQGKFMLRDTPVVPGDHPVLLELARAALLCNDASLHPDGDRWLIQGDPTEAALLTLAHKSGLQQLSANRAWPRGDVIPFESERRFMATLHHDHNRHGYIYVKGAPEQILAMCAYQRTAHGDEPLDMHAWHERMDDMAGRGLRLLAIAAKPAAAQQHVLEFRDIESDLSLLGVVGLIDPPREEAIRAVQECHAAGIRVKMITGDHARTATVIGAQLAIGDGKTALTGPEIDKMSDEQLRARIRQVDVFARTSPEHKLKLVNLLQEMNEVVAMTGDGVNDAPALRRADVGIAMGKKGTEVAAEASQMVLTDDNFASIVQAVKEGRTVYDNLKKSILFILPTNGGEALTVIAAILTGISLPITAVQILWINMVTEVTLALALAFEPAEARVMQRPPRDPAEPILSGFLLWRIVFVSLILVAGTFGLFLWQRATGASVEYARTVAVNTLVMFEVFYLFNTRHLYTPVLNRDGLCGNRYVWYAIGVLAALQLAFTYLAPLQQVFATVALAPADWIRIALVASSVLILVEIEKWLQAMVERRRTRSANPVNA
jgi:magnesium-transporting ATPase (P-type)